MLYSYFRYFQQLHIQTGVEVELHCSGIHICLELLLFIGHKLVCYGILANCKYLYFMTNFDQCVIKMVSYFFYIVTSPVQVR